MSITIATPTRRYVIKKEDRECEEMFDRLVREMIGIETQAPEVSVPELVPIMEVESTSLPQIQTQAKQEMATEKYRGFLYIKCADCGHVHAFCSKYDLSYHKCPECGAKTELSGLIPMYLSCECGKMSTYMTNVDEFAFDIDCIECGSPVSVKYNSHKNIIETIV